MEHIRREIKLFWARNGKPLLQIIGFILLVIMVIQGLNQYTILSNKEKAEQELETKEQRETEKKKQEDIKEDKEFISKFIDYCNKNNIEEAYQMLSTKCKEKKYLSIKNFKEKYINKIFGDKKDFEITLKEDNIYKIVFLEDILQAGKIENRRKIEDYYRIEEDVLGNKTITINLYNNQ